MVMHAIVLEEENAQVAERIAAHYPKHYRVNDTCFLVRTEDLSSKVAANLKIDGADKSAGAPGVVLKLNGARSGFADSALWEWFDIRHCATVA